jgi:hypothetical protein
MTTRRFALIGVLGSCWAFISCARSQRGSTSRSKTDDAVGDALEEFDRQLLEDFSRVGSRTYSEEGIAVFLVGENLAGPDRDRLPVVPASRDTSPARLAAAFREYASALLRVRPDATEEDVATLVEVLADRAFGKSGHGTQP